MTKEAYRENGLFGSYGSMGVCVLDGRTEAWWLKLESESLQLETQRGKKKQTRNKYLPPVASYGKTTPHELPQRVQPTGDQMFEYLVLCGTFSFKPPQRRWKKLLITTWFLGTRVSGLVRVLF